MHTFVSAYPSTSPPYVDSLLARALTLAARPDRWPTPPRFSSERRWYSRLDTDGPGEAWLLTWLPGQGTEWHDHGGSAGAFVVASGRLREDRLPAGGTVAEHYFTAGDGHGFSSHFVHRVVNDHDVPAISVHVYAPALSAMTRYEFAGSGLTPVGVERAGADW